MQLCGMQLCGMQLFHLNIVIENFERAFTDVSEKLAIQHCYNYFDRFINLLGVFLQFF